MVGTRVNPDDSLSRILEAALTKEAKTSGTDLFKICSKFNNPVIVKILIGKACNAYCDTRDNKNPISFVAGIRFFDAILSITLNTNNEVFSQNVAEFDIDVINYIYRSSEAFKPLLLKLSAASESDNVKFENIKQGMETIMCQYGWLEKQVIDVHHDSKHYSVKNRKTLTPTHSKLALDVDQKALQPSASAAHFTFHAKKASQKNTSPVHSHSPLNLSVKK